MCLGRSPLGQEIFSLCASRVFDFNVLHVCVAVAVEPLQEVCPLVTVLSSAGETKS